MKKIFSNKVYLKYLINQMDNNGDNVIDELEFVSYLLVQQPKVTWEDLHVLRHQCKVLDQDRDGTLTLDDIRTADKLPQEIDTQ